PAPVRAHPSLRGLERVARADRAAHERAVELLGRGDRRRRGQHRRLAPVLCDRRVRWSTARREIRTVRADQRARPRSRGAQGRALHLAPRPALMDLLVLDDQLYRAIFSAAVQSPALTALAVGIYWINWNGLLWWVAGVLIARARGFVRRGWWEMLVVYLGMVD